MLCIGEVYEAGDTEGLGAIGPGTGRFEGDKVFASCQLRFDIFKCVNGGGDLYEGMRREGQVSRIHSGKPP
jgi:hypothetical protein